MPRLALYAILGIAPEGWQGKSGRQSVPGLLGLMDLEPRDAETPNESTGNSTINALKVPFYNGWTYTCSSPISLWH